ncbi:MAG TPA: MauE/DoxX family redox-associated membrane protein [Woeseiaceae bacterium]|nr:MauE/DoxX family redox-associated membrane protein [Woeseiaceae bacterium]
MASLLVTWAALFFSGLLLLAASHKVFSLAVFRAVLRDYALLPDAFVAPASVAIPVAEAMLAAAWLAAAANVLAATAAAAATVALLTAYTLAIAVNLLRGRRYISCGCGLAGGGAEYLSWGLVLRNAFLVGVALLAAAPVPAYASGPGGYAVLVVALLAAVILYAAAAQLLRNGAAIGAWRQARE